MLQDLCNLSDPKTEGFEVGRAELLAKLVGIVTASMNSVIDDRPGAPNFRGTAREA